MCKPENWDCSAWGREDSQGIINMHKYLNRACKEDRLFPGKVHGGRTRGNMHRRFFPNVRKHILSVKVTADCTERLWSLCSEQTLSWENWLRFEQGGWTRWTSSGPLQPTSTSLWFCDSMELGKGSPLQVNQWWSLPGKISVPLTMKKNTHSYYFQMLRSKYEGSWNYRLSSNPMVEGVPKKLDRSKESTHVSLTEISCFKNFPCFEDRSFLLLNEEMLQCERRGPAETLVT